VTNLFRSAPRVVTFCNQRSTAEQQIKESKNAINRARLSWHSFGNIEAWRVDYNTKRPHSALGYATPAEFASSLQGHAPGEMTTSARPGQNQQPELSC
jgi:hypothetical protein